MFCSEEWAIVMQTRDMEHTRMFSVDLIDPLMLCASKDCIGARTSHVSDNDVAIRGCVIVATLGHLLR
jgi:hypothetical protein